MHTFVCMYVHTVYVFGKMCKLSHMYVHAHIPSYIVCTVEPLQLWTLWTTSKSNVDCILCSQYLRSVYICMYIGIKRRDLTKVLWQEIFCAKQFSVHIMERSMKD